MEVTPSAMASSTRLRSASAVISTKGMANSFSSARMACNSSTPVITGMFQSDSTTSKCWPLSMRSASAPLRADSMRSTPNCRSWLMVTLRMASKSSTTRQRAPWPMGEALEVGKMLMVPAPPGWFGLGRRQQPLRFLHPRNAGCPRPRWAPCPSATGGAPG